MGNEAWNDFVDQGGSRWDHAPDHGNHSTGDHTGDSTLGVETLPVQSQQNQWAEGGAEACPSEANQTQDGVGWVNRKDTTDNGDDKNCATGQVDQSLLAELLVGDHLPQVLNEGGGNDQQLRRHGGHDCCQNSGQNQASNKWVEHDLSHVQEDGFEGLLVSDGVVGLGKEDRTYDGGKYRTCDGEEHPGDAVCAAGLGIGSLTHRHEADDDVWLAKVAQAPCSVTDDGCSRNTGDHVEVVRVLNSGGAIRILSGEGEDF